MQLEDNSCPVFDCHAPIPVNRKVVGGSTWAKVTLNKRFLGQTIVVVNDSIGHDDDVISYLKVPEKTRLAETESRASGHALKHHHGAVFGYQLHGAP